MTEISFCEESLQPNAEQSFDSAQELLEYLEPLLDEHRYYREEVRHTIKFALSPNQISELQQMHAHAFNATSRSERRFIQRQDQVQIAYLNLLFGNAKIYAQQTAVGSDESLVERGNTFYKDAQEIVKDPEATQVSRYTNELWLKVFDDEQKRTLTERHIIGSLEQYIHQSPTSVLEFLQIIQQVDTDEYYELLLLLQKDVEDMSFETSLIKDAVSELGDNPSLFKDEFIEAVDTELTRGSEEGDILDGDQYQWLSFMTDAVGKNAVIEHLRSVTVMAWPQSIQTALDETVNTFLHDVWHSYKTMLDGIGDKSIHYLQPEFVDKLEATYYQRIGKLNGGQKQNGRAASKHGSVDQVVGREEQRSKPIESVSLMIKPDRVWRVSGGSEENSDNDDSFLDIVSKRLMPKRCEVDISELHKMIDSLTSQPYGNGANKLPNETISILVDGFIRRAPLRIFRPASRKGLGINREAKKLAISYVIHPDKTRKELILVGISS